MAVALEVFVKQLEDSGVITPGKLENFIPPKAQPKDAQELARQLVQSKQLTKFQAQEIYQGRAKSLILGNYTILDKIGAGGMGQVFKAQHRRLDRIVAIKMLPKAMMKDPAAAARFDREVKAAAKLRHPNIVATDDADEANGSHFLVMECIEGSDLAALVKRDGPFSVAKAVNLTLQAARGLEFAHAEGVIHRDIKPANLLLDKKGAVKILDMGLARIESGSDAAPQAELTGTGAVMGTVDYMAPEQAMSTKHADARSDIYSLGCTMYYLLSAKPTYDGDSLMAKLLAHASQPIPALQDVRAGVSELLQAVFNLMVAKKAEDRYQTMSEVIAALEQCTGSQHTSVSLQQSIDTNPDADAMTFLRDVPIHTTHKPGPTKKTAPRDGGKRNKKFVFGAVGAALSGLAIVAGVLFKIQTKVGTLIVEVDQPDAVVQVLDSAGKVEVSQKGGVGRITIDVDPGKHRLKVEKDGFAVYGQHFEIARGEKKEITAKLEAVRTVAGQNKPWNTPAFQAWMQDVAAMPTEKQVEAVSEKLQELNPGFDGKVTGWNGLGMPKTENGVVTELKLIVDNVTDISPVRSLVGLQRLDCGNSNSKNTASFSDLSPLRGMRLTYLSCPHSRISDLSPLEGMPLSTLIVHGTQAADLSPLKGMPLEKLGCDSVKASDLSPLRGMPLKILQCAGTDVADLSPLRGLPLTDLSINWTRVSNLSPLEDCKSLRVVLAERTKVTASDVAALQKALPNCKIEWDDPVKATTPEPANIDLDRKAAEWAIHKAGGLPNCGVRISLAGRIAEISRIEALPPGRFQLIGVGFSKVKISDDELENLTGLQHLQMVVVSTGADVSFASMTGKGLRHLTNPNEMNEVNLGGQNVTLEGLSYLRTMKKLGRLDLAYSKVTDDGLGHIVGLLDLHTLKLQHTTITDSGTTHLAPLKSLKYLDLTGTKLTPAGVAALQKALPNCKIEWGTPAKPKTPQPAAAGTK